MIAQPGGLMPKYLIEATYTAEGIRGLIKDKASGRRAAIESAVKAVGAKIEGFYYAFGEADAYVLCDCPDASTAAAISLAVTGSGVVRAKTTPLLTVEEMDQALGKQVPYKAPGK
jgi:uncharacterized protein with GYD domain